MDAFQLAPLPYAADALEPVIGRQTIEIHHGRHLQTYVNNLNALLPGSGREGLSLVELVSRTDSDLQQPSATEGLLALHRNAGQVLNHELYFAQFRPKRENNVPDGELMEAIGEEFGSFALFREQFQKAGATLFGSGWVWLSARDNGSLVITQEANAQNPVQHGLRPLLTFDVWEHAYYLDYQNRRPDHLAALWDIIDWEVIERRYITH